MIIRPVPESLFGRVKESHSSQTIPTAKKFVSDQHGLQAWMNYYAGFSPRFVHAVTGFLKLNSESLVFDPFAGTGTTNVVCKSRNIPSIGVELNPVSYVVANAKLAWNLETTSVAKQIKLLGPKLITRDFHESFGSNLLSAASARYLLAAGENVLSLPKELRFFLLAAILETLRRLVITRFGTNPTWPKRTYQRSSTSSHAYSILEAIVQRRLQDIIRYRSNPNCKAAVLYGDATEFVPRFKADAIITSPPYLNRLDYVMNYELENSFLLALSYPVASTIDQLRSRMMGTVKVTEDKKPNPAWGKTCTKLLEKIRLHPSKAADCYYHKTICRYFDALYRSIHLFHRSLRKDGVCCVVLQTSYFKNIELPLPTISVEMAENVGFNRTSFLREDRVQRHLGRTDPDQRKWKKRKLLTEKIALLER